MERGEARAVSGRVEMGERFVERAFGRRGTRRRGDRGASTRVPCGPSGAGRILSSTSRERRVHPDPNPERRRARAMRRRAGSSGARAPSRGTRRDAEHRHRTRAPPLARSRRSLGVPPRARRAWADAIRRSRDGKRWERRKARTATTEKPVCETRAAGAGARSCAPAKAPVRESPAMLRRPAIVRVVCCVHVCARKCRAKHPRATLGVRDVAFHFCYPHLRSGVGEKFSYTGKLNPSSGIHFLSENLGLEGITAARALSLGRRKLGNAVDRSAKSCFGDVFAQTAAERCGLDASRPPAQRAAPERRGVVETATACEARTCGERGRGRSSSAREHARGPVGRASVLIASERGPNGHARSREARAMGGGSGGGRGVQMAPPPFKANPSHIKYRAYTEGDVPNADVRVRPSPAFLSSSALSVSARIRRSTVSLGRV